MAKKATQLMIGRAQDESAAHLDCTRLTFGLAGIILPLLALNMIEGLAIVAVPRAVADLRGLDRYSWPSTSFLLTSTISMPAFAKLSDLYGRKWFYLFGAAMSVAYALSCDAGGNLAIPLDGMNQIVLASGLLGLGHGTTTVLSFTIVADLFPPLERGRYQGLLAAVSILPFTVGPSIVAVYLPLVLQGVLGASATKTGVIFGEYVLATVAGNVIGRPIALPYRLVPISGDGRIRASHHWPIPDVPIGRRRHST